MATEIKIWQIRDGTLNPVKSSLIESKLKEREHLEQWIRSNPEILGNDIVLIGEQVPTDSGPLDFLGIDSNGNLIVVELKRDSLPREALAQVIDYAANVASWDVEKINGICLTFTKLELEELLTERFPDINIEEFVINQEQRLLLVGFAIEESLDKMIKWISSRYDMSINAIVLNYTKTTQGDEILARTVIISEEIEKTKPNRRRGNIYLEFFNELSEMFKIKYQAVNNGKSQSQQVIEICSDTQYARYFSADKEGLWYYWEFTKENGWHFSLALYLNTSIKINNINMLHQIEKSKDAIEKELGTKLDFQEYPTESWCGIDFIKIPVNGKITNLNEEERKKLISWGSDKMISFVRVMSKYIKNLE